MSPVQMGVSYSIKRVLRLLLGDEFNESEPAVAAVELLREAQALDLSEWTEQLPDVLLGRLERLQEGADFEPILNPEDNRPLRTAWRADIPRQ
jgi:hypothetical protein